MITDEGEKPIEEIQVGDKVLSQNVDTGEKGYKEVKQLFVHEVDTLYHVQIKGITISNTEEHPYWVVGKGWVEAKDLKVGDQVLLASGEKAAIENVTKEKLETPVKVYNFEVADWHTYFVADIGVLVHNDCTGKVTVNNVLKGTNQKGEITTRGSFRKDTLQDSWDNAEPGPNGGKLCPTCKEEVKVKPFSGEKRDWHVDHKPAWTNRVFPANVTRKEVLDNYQKGTRLECPSCNIRGGNRRD